MVDLDLFDQSEELKEYGEAFGSRLILSYHNYKQTPDDAELMEIVQQMRAFSAATLKISCFCENYRDAFRLLELDLALKEMGRSHVVLGMGTFGRITRVIGPLVGSSIAYAPLDPNHASASGQLTLRELKQILEQLKK